eukprot:UN3800
MHMRANLPCVTCLQRCECLKHWHHVVQLHQYMQHEGRSIMFSGAVPRNRNFRPGIPLMLFLSCGRCGLIHVNNQWSAIPF